MVRAMMKLNAPLHVLFLLALAACKPVSISGDDSQPVIEYDDSESDADTDADADTDTDADGDSVIDDTSPPIDYDCEALPDFNLGDTTLTEARAYHGIAFTQDGYLVGWNGYNAVVRSSYDGVREVFVPGVLGMEQLDHLADGDIVGSDTSGARLIRITADGGTETISTNSGYAYGVTTGPDRNIYIADGGVHRIDIETGEKTTLIRQPRQWTAHSLAFNLDSTRLYIGSIGRGDVYYVDLDDDLNPVGEPQIFASNVGRGWHDGLGFDACGNLYVADYSSAGLYRVSPEGVITPMYNPGNTTIYGHGLQWGNGQGGWRADALYLPMPYSGSLVREVVVGVPAGDFLRTWRGEPAPW